MSICRFREWTNLQFQRISESDPPGKFPTFSSLKESMIGVINRVAKEEEEWLPGVKWPEWPVFFPAPFWGATPLVSRQRKQVLVEAFEEEEAVSGGAPTAPVAEIAAGVEELGVAGPSAEVEVVVLEEEEEGFPTITGC